MVRSLVGAVVPVGEGRLPVGVPRQVLLGGVRDSRVRVMPPHGLSLEEVTYPADHGVAARAAESRVRRVLPG
jgi:tRNA pseudouridine38-40 synthase